MNPRVVTLWWLGAATAMAVIGWLLAMRFSSVLPYASSPLPGNGWDVATDAPLFAGLALLGFGFVPRQWARRVTMAGWLLFAFYWALVAQDLYEKELGDTVNLVFAILGVYFFTYLAYHQWLSEVRRVESHTVRFLNIATFVAAGAYFVIDKIEPVRRWLIIAVSNHTFWMLNLFGQGKAAGLVYNINPNGSTVDDPSVSNALSQFCYRGFGCTYPLGNDHWAPPPPQNFLQSVLHYDPTGGDPHVLPVSIILACTALQSMMLFVGLYLATPAPWKKRIAASAIVAAVVYVLNLVRNTGIIWFYGQGHASFWVMHDAVGKGGSLIAMVAIAFASFALFPEFLHALIGVLDLPQRDGPIERTLHLGRRRPETQPPGWPPTPPGSPPATPPGAPPSAANPPLR